MSIHKVSFAHDCRRRTSRCDAYSHPPHARKNQHYYQVGNNGTHAPAVNAKAAHSLPLIIHTFTHTTLFPGDLTGYAVLEAARSHGSMIHTAHEHSFSRTVEMSSFENFFYDNSTEGVPLHFLFARTHPLTRSHTHTHTHTHWACCRDLQHPPAARDPRGHSLSLFSPSLACSSSTALH